MVPEGVGATITHQIGLKEFIADLSANESLTNMYDQFA
jgi:hypothetical protein